MLSVRTYERLPTSFTLYTSLSQQIQQKGPYDLADFCESKFAESRDREWDLSWKVLRVENENESSWAKSESREWEWEIWGKKWEWEWDSSIFKNGGLIKTESELTHSLALRGSCVLVRAKAMFTFLLLQRKVAWLFTLARSAFLFSFTTHSSQKQSSCLKREFLHNTYTVRS